MEALADVLSPYELDRGKPMPTLTHGAIQANIVMEMGAAYRKSYRIASEVSLATLPEGSTPDVVFYPKMTFGEPNEPARRTDPPLVCVEITGPPSRSPSQSLNLMVEKTAMYFAFGVRSCWVVLPDIRAVLVYNRPGHYTFFHEDDILHDTVLNIKLPLSGIFS
jgi:Putative restriction endonuclease